MQFSSTIPETTVISFYVCLYFDLLRLFGKPLDKLVVNGEMPAVLKVSIHCWQVFLEWRLVLVSQCMCTMPSVTCVGHSCPAVH